MSVRRRVLDAGAETGYPLSREALVAHLEDDEEALLIVRAMADDLFLVPDELAERLDDALGMPAADPATSALEDPTQWHPDSAS